MLHRIDEIEELPGPRFFSLCYRLTNYQGVIANAWRRQVAKRAQQQARGPVSLAEWASEHRDAIAQASAEMNDGGR